MKIKLYYFFNDNTCLDDVDRIEVITYDIRGEYQGNRIFLQEIETEVPDCRIPTKEEIANGLIDILREEKSKILAETHLKVSKIDDKIQQLLCIEMKDNND